MARAPKSATDTAPAASKPATTKAAGAAADAAKYGKRADYGAPVDAYFAKLSPEQLAIAEALRAIVREAVPTVREEIKWGMPVYSTSQLLCYFTAKPAYVRFGFYKPDGLDDPEGLLTGSMPHVKLRTLADIDTVRLGAWTRAAAAAAQGAP